MPKTKAKITNQIQESKPLDLDQKKITWFLVVGVILVAVFAFKGVFVAALVNGKPISRLSVIKSLEKQGGSQTLDDLVTKELVKQEAQKNNVEVTKEEMDAEIAKIEGMLKNQGMSLDSALAASGQTKAELAENIRYQKTVEKLISKDIAVSDKEIKDYFDQNKANLGKDATFESTKEQIKAQLTQAKLGEKYREWTLSLREKANVRYFVNYYGGLGM